MMRNTLVLIASFPLILGACADCGCGRKKSPDVAKTAEKGEVTPAVDSKGVEYPLEDPAKTIATTDNHRSAPSKPPADQPEIDLGGTWTTRRLIVLSESGPTLIDLSVSLGRQSLQEAGDEALARVLPEILDDLEQPVKWEQLLEQPLIRSGWLGNLVPEQEQREQLIAMYDLQRDNEVSSEELKSFLSRGLARSSPMQIVDAGSEPNSEVGKSPWGKADVNNDFALDEDELASLPQMIMQLDYNGDGLITAREASGTPIAAMQTGPTSRTSMLRATTLMFVDETSDTDAREAAKSMSKLASAVMRHYTFLEKLSREQWPDWSDSDWNEADADQDQSLDRTELESILSRDPHIHLYVRMPALEGKAEDVMTHAELVPPNRSVRWMASQGGGQLFSRSCAAQLVVTDVFSAASRDRLRQQLEQALESPQRKAQVANQLQLREDAFDLLDSDGDNRLSDSEFELAWRWITLRQGTRCSARWVLVNNPWYQLANQDAYERLTEREIQSFSRRLAELDRNADSIITPNELPLVARLEMARSDPRLDGVYSAQANEAVAQSGWHSAMDTNRDNYVSYGEFLGSRADFADLDLDKDGFLSRDEVYEGGTSH